MAQQDFLDGHKAHLDHVSLGVGNRVSSTNHSSIEKASLHAMDGV